MKFTTSLWFLALLALCLTTAFAAQDVLPGASRRGLKAASEVITNITSLTIPEWCTSGALVIECGMRGPNPCTNAICPAFPGAPCMYRTCKSRYRGQILNACTPIFYDRATQDVLNCQKGAITSITKCAKDAAQALCTPDALNSCKNQTCPANSNATCIVKTCTALYRGQFLMPCEPIWYDKKTGNVLDSATECTCSSTQCTDVGYKPVCGKDGKTYPNSCAALCSGTTVKKNGRCAKCSGTPAQCKYGMFGDTCVVGATNQCNPAELLCLDLSDSGSSGDHFTLGTCTRI